MSPKSERQTSGLKPSQTLWAIVAVLAAIASVQLSAVFARELFHTLGPAGAVFLRQGLSLVMLLIFNPVWKLNWRQLDWRQIGLYGVSIGVMNFTFYLALERIPLGIAVALEFLGPLGVALAGSRKRIDFLWVACAGLGLVALLPLEAAALKIDPLGALFALMAALGWAGYILVGQSLGRAMPVGLALTLSMGVSLIFVAPISLSVAGHLLMSPAVMGPVIGVAVALAIGSCALPYSLEIAALKHMPARTFSLLMSLEPAAGALVGLCALGERLSALQFGGIGLIAAAAAGSSLGLASGDKAHSPVETPQP